MKNLFLKIIYKVLASYARIVIKKYNPTVIAITGTVGKTSTKEAIFQVLSDAFPGKVRRSFGNLNAEIGIPLSILGYDSLPNKFLWPIFLVSASRRINQKNYPAYLILEMGVEKKGDLKYFASIVKPKYLVVTSVGMAHLTNFSDLSEYQNEKLSILDEVTAQGKILLNYDDPMLQKISNDKVISVAVKNLLAKYHAEDIKLTTKGTEFRICRSGRKIAIKSHLLGEHLINSSVFAFALADILNVSLLQTGKSLEKLAQYPGRMNIISGSKETTIIDDSYNANPASVKAALVALSQIVHKERKVLILGNMNELGGLEKKYHEEIGAFALNRCDFAIFVGPNAKTMQKGYGDKKTSIIFDSRQDLIDHLSPLIKSGDLILVKASQNGNYFEEVVKSLMQNPKKADKLLVRQSKFWLAKKAQKRKF